MSTRYGPDALSCDSGSYTNREGDRRDLRATLLTAANMRRGDAVTRVWEAHYTDRPRSWVNRHLSALVEAAKHGDESLARILLHADPTGSAAVHRVMSPGCTCSRCTNHTNKKTAPMHKSPNRRIEAA